MSKKIIVLLILGMVLILSGCAKDELQEPETGLLFAIDPNSKTQFDEYELNLKDEEGGFTVVTLKKSDGYQSRWAQSLVDDRQGKTYTVITLQGYNTRKSGDLAEYATPFTLTFEKGMTNLGRLVKIKLD